MKILGINDYSHDTSTSSVVDGKIKYAVEEERLINNKHAKGFIENGKFPLKSMKEILKRENISEKSIDLVSVGWNLNLEKAKNNAIKQYENYKKLNPNDTFSKKKLIDKTIKNFKRREEFFKKNFGWANIQYINHHLAHASSSYRCSNFKDALILVMDGAGEEDWLSIYAGEENKISKLKSFPIENSLGNLYTYFTKLIGFNYFDEGKFMGLSAYGKVLNKKLFYFDTIKEKILIDYEKISKFNKERNSGRFKFVKKYKDIAATIQFNLQNTILQIVNYYLKKYEKENICLSGGIALNCLTNGKIMNLHRVKNIYIPNFANDSGVSLGAALESTSYFRDCYKLNIQNADLGFDYNIDEFIKNIEKFRVSPIKDYTQISKKLTDDKIIALFQGRFEFGPRALGNRSILANPQNKKFKKLINYAKGRNQWRPFACMLLKKHLNKMVFSNNFDAPFMNIAFDVKSNKLGAVKHKDGTTRIQTVSKSNKNVYKILKSFYDLTGVPALLNTSLNFKGQPIIDTPKKALKFFEKSDYLDILILGNYLIEKKISLKEPRFLKEIVEKKEYQDKKKRSVFFHNGEKRNIKVQGNEIKHKKFKLKKKFKGMNLIFDSKTNLVSLK